MLIYRDRMKASNTSNLEKTANVSTVLWANLLQDGCVTLDEEDKYALYKHTDKLDRFASNLGLISFAAICDTTDVQFNLGDDELPDGIESTNEVMALKGAWISAAEAQKLISGLLEHVLKKQTRFGLFSNDHDVVVEELAQTLSFLKSATFPLAKFNFSVVM